MSTILAGYLHREVYITRGRQMDVDNRRLVSLKTWVNLGPILDFGDVYFSEPLRLKPV